MEIPDDFSSKLNDRIQTAAQESPMYDANMFAEYAVKAVKTVLKDRNPEEVQLLDLAGGGGEGLNDKYYPPLLALKLRALNIRPTVMDIGDLKKEDLQYCNFIKCDIIKLCLMFMQNPKTLDEQGLANSLDIITTQHFIGVNPSPELTTRLNRRGISLDQFRGLVFKLVHACLKEGGHFICDQELIPVFTIYRKIGDNFVTVDP